MKRSKTMICIAAFTAITAIKLISPAFSDSVLDEVLNVMQIERAENGSVATLGSRLTSCELIEIFSESDS